MDLDFAELMRSVIAKYAELIACPAHSYPLTKTIPKSPGVYVFYDTGVAKYVGRTGNLRKRLSQHQTNGSKDNQAAFASCIAKRKCGLSRTYHLPRTDPRHFSQNPEFLLEFAAAKLAIRGMQFRVVEESHPTRQALLEIYTATVLKAESNDFDNH